MELHFYLTVYAEKNLETEEVVVLCSLLEVVLTVAAVVAVAVAAVVWMDDLGLRKKKHKLLRLTAKKASADQPVLAKTECQVLCSRVAEVVEVAVAVVVVERFRSVLRSVERIQQKKKHLRVLDLSSESHHQRNEKTHYHLKSRIHR